MAELEVPLACRIRTLCAPFLLLSASAVLSAQSTPTIHASIAALRSDLPDDPAFLPAAQAATPTSSSAGQAVPPQATDHPGETDAQRQAREQREEAAREVKEEEKQRFGGVMPQFNVVMNGHAVPLTPKEKFDLSFHTIIDPYTIGLAVIVGGGLGELNDSHTGYGHGAAGLFKRIGASYADNVDGNLIGNALLPILLHQDPRYFRKGEGPIKSRIVYSALTSFICHSDSGKRQFNTSNVAGNFLSGAISNAYYPADERGVGLTLQNGLIVTLEGMLGAQILEFSPDISNAVHRHRQAKRDAADAAARAAAQPPTP